MDTQFAILFDIWWFNKNGLTKNTAGQKQWMRKPEATLSFQYLLMQQSNDLSLNSK